MPLYIPSPHKTPGANIINILMSHNATDNITINITKYNNPSQNEFVAFMHNINIKTNMIKNKMAINIVIKYATNGHATVKASAPTNDSPALNSWL